MPTVLWLLLDFLCLKNYVNVPSKSNKQKNFVKTYMTKIGSGSGSINQRHGSRGSGSTPKCHGSGSLKNNILASQTTLANCYEKTPRFTTFSLVLISFFFPSSRRRWATPYKQAALSRHSSAGAVWAACPVFGRTFCPALSRADVALAAALTFANLALADVALAEFVALAGGAWRCRSCFCSKSFLFVSAEPVLLTPSSPPWTASQKYV